MRAVKEGEEESPATVPGEIPPPTDTPGLETEIRELLASLEAEPENPVPIFERLNYLTGLNPVLPGHEGKFRLMIEDWLEWGDGQGLLPEKEQSRQEEETVPDGEHPLVSVLSRVDARLASLESQGEEVRGSLKKLAGIMELLVEVLSRKSEPWSDPQGAGRPREPEEDGSSSPSPAEHPTRALERAVGRTAIPVRRDPPTIREGRTYV